MLLKTGLIGRKCNISKLEYTQEHQEKATYSKHSLYNDCFIYCFFLTNTKELHAFTKISALETLNTFIFQNMKNHVSQKSPFPHVLRNGNNSSKKEEQLLVEQRTLMG